MLTLTMRFLTGRYVSTEFYDFERAEWPPHPSRVFYALVASLHEDEIPESQSHEALEWLEAQGPPEVYASDYRTREVVTMFVPVNALQAKEASPYISEGVPVPRERQSRSFPTVVPSVPFVHILWRNAIAPEVYLEALSKLANRVSYLGHSSSFVALTFDQREPPVEGLKRYVPSGDGEVMLRVPRRGLLAELEEAFLVRGEEKVQLPYEPVRYRVISQQEVGRIPPKGIFDPRFIIFRGAAGSQPLVTATFRVTSALRGAMISKAISTGMRLSEHVSGHRHDGSATDRPHVAIIPLPDVGFRYSNGSLKGVAFVLPSGLSVDERNEALRAIGSLGEHVRLRLGSVGEWTLKRDPLGGGLTSLSPETWTGPSKEWATVTPVVLDRFPKKPYSDESKAIVEQSCLRAGLPRPSRVEVSPFSWIVGVPPVREFVPYRKEGMPPRIHVHAHISFDEEIQGPVLVGAGRFYGMGMMRPL